MKCSFCRGSGVVHGEQCVACAGLGAPRDTQEDLDAALGLLRLLVAGHRYVKGCKSNGGLACYNCRTIEWLTAHSDYVHKDPT
jgi:hypothetical protein